MKLTLYSCKIFFILKIIGEVIFCNKYQSFCKGELGKITGVICNIVLSIFIQILKHNLIYSHPKDSST